MKLWEVLEKLAHFVFDGSIMTVGLGIAVVGERLFDSGFQSPTLQGVVRIIVGAGLILLGFGVMFVAAEDAIS